MCEQEELAQRIVELTGWKHPGRVSIVTDTSDCMRINRGQVVRLEGRDYVIKGNKYETRFGIGHQPKYWVFAAIDLETGADKIIKTVFHEEFHVHIGVFRIHCYRSPEKEARVLKLVDGDPRFMQGYTVFDDNGNNVRVIDLIRGETMFNYVYFIEKSHEDYFHTDLPGILRKLVGSFEAIAHLHQHGTCHGDIRNDHILIEAKTGQYRWIDFDLNQHVADFDVWSIGNVINYVVGKGINSFANVLKDKSVPQRVKDSLTPQDASAFYEYRIMNLARLYPYIPPRLTDILGHFAVNPRATYTTCGELIEEFHEMLDTEFSAN